MLHFRFFQRMTRGTLLWGALACSLAMPFGCNPGTSPHGQIQSSFEFEGNHPIRAVATVGMVADLVRAVGGEHLVVEQLLGAGVDPHLYKASRDDVRAIVRADLVFYSGLMLEGKMLGTLQKVSLTRPVYAVTEGIPNDQVRGEGGDHVDPHVWMNVNLWIECLGEVERRLSEFDPIHADDYHRNATAFRQEMSSLNQYAINSIATIPAEHRIFVTSHDAFHYFGEAYHLDVMGIQGISTESEAGLRRVNQLVDLLVEKKVPAVFFESSVPQRSAEALVAGVKSRGHQIKIDGPLYSDAMGEAGTYEGTYLGMIDHNVTLVVKSLGGQVPERGWRNQLTFKNSGELP